MAAENTGWVELGEGDLAELQRFIVANPQYWRVVMEREPPATAAREIFDDQPPAEWPWERKCFITAAHLHGTGGSADAYASLERWMRSRGAQWIRLGVVVGNARAERFWEKAGFREVRRRYGIEVEGRERDLRVMVKPLGRRGFDDYLAVVERDRPE